MHFRLHQSASENDALNINPSNGSSISYATERHCNQALNTSSACLLERAVSTKTEAVISNTGLRVPAIGATAKVASHERRL